MKGPTSTAHHEEAPSRRGLFGFVGFLQRAIMGAMVTRAGTPAVITTLSTGTLLVSCVLGPVGASERQVRFREETNGALTQAEPDAATTNRVHIGSSSHAFKTPE